VLAVKADDRGGPLRRIVVPVDFSAPGDHARDVGIALAKRFRAEVHLVHAFDAPLAVMVPYDMVLPESAIAAAREMARRKLDAAVEQAREAGVEATGHLADVPAAQQIAALARELRADLVVMGTHGHTGIRHVLLGSTAERTLRLAPCAVLTVKQADTQLDPPGA
jgi:universal stress protein A